jgi:beta-glucosidase
LKPILPALIVAAACVAATADSRDAAPNTAPLSCREIVASTGDLPRSAVRWYEQEGTRSRATLDAWCRGVGPAVYHSHPANASDNSPADVGRAPIAVVSWNVNVGAGDLPEFVADLRAGKWSDGRRVEHFVLLLQEALRTGDAVPPRGPSQAGARRLLRSSPRVDIVSFARESGLSLLYVPSMRNGLDASAPSEDRGNAILATLPLIAPGALELPFSRQRRVATLATLGGLGDSAPLGIMSVHLDPFVGANRLWVFGAAGARGRQARAIAATLPPGGPMIVGGDFNTWLGTSEPALREMARVSGQPPQAREGTYASGAVLDYLFFRTPASWRATYERSGQTYGSDHYPLIGWITPAQSPSATPDDGTVRKRAAMLVAQMTPEEKAAQLTQYFYIPIGPTKELAEKELRAGRVGALLFVSDFRETNRLQKIAIDSSRLKIPLLFGFDVIHGLRTIFPVPIAMAASWDPALVEQGQAIAASEARAVGIHWAFAPMVDIARDPRWGRIVEGAGEDPYLGSAMAAAQVRGFQGPFIGSPGHIVSGPKHFAGYGASLGGRDYDEVNLSENELWNVYLPPFAAAVKAGAGNVMSCYMGLNGVPCAGNRWLLTDVLRGTWKFDGFVVSDANGVVNLATHGFARDAQDSAARAVGAGLDMEMAFAGAAFRNLPEALAKGEVTVAALDEAVRRVLETKIRLGLFENPFVDEVKAAEVLSDRTHRDAARVAAERSAVLLRNEGGLLPLSAGALKSLAVIGHLADAPRDMLGPWVFDYNLDEAVTILAGIKAKVGNNVGVDYARGVVIPPRKFASPFAMIPGNSPPPPANFEPAAEFEKAVAAARGADAVVIVLGEHQDMIGEVASRSTLELPGRQQELLDAVVATGKPVVLVLMNGRPLDLRAAAKVPAILEVWYPGTQGGTAVANLLFGDATPGGKLPFSWPRHVGQVPLIYSRLASHDPGKAGERYFNEESTPFYPFGFGLSYSTFAFDRLMVDRQTIKAGETLTVSVDVRNTGQRKADEVAQLYIHQRYGSAARPVRELKGFQRVTLAPNESRTLKFTLGPDELRYWSAAKKDWVVEPSTFDVWVGGDSTAKLSATVEVVSK